MAVLRGSTGTVGPINTKVYTRATVQVVDGTATVAVQGTLDGSNWVVIAAATTYATNGHTVYSTGILFGQIRAVVSAVGTTGASTGSAVHLIGG